jgi:glutamyl-tRNA reductase
MAILTLGISFRRAPIELLERLAFTDDDLAKTYRHALDLDGVAGVVILSTCNRVEVYADVPSYHAGFLALKRLLTETRGVSADELSEPLYAHWEQDAAQHLFCVAAGLDSMVLGETQIYAQVREAMRRADAEGAAGASLEGLFHSATRAGRRVRQETTLGAAPDAFVALAAQLAAEELGGLEGRDALIVGAGQMAALAARHLRARRVSHLQILNRSIEHAEALAGHAGADHGDLGALPEALARADLVVSATGAAGTVIEADAVAAARRARPTRPLVLIDLAVPRDVEPEAGSIDGVHLIDILTLRNRVADRDEETAAQIAEANRIVAQEMRRFVVRRRGDELAPLIRQVRARGDRVMAEELTRHASRLADLTPEQRKAVEAFARGIVAKLLHDPLVGLKERSAPGTDALHAKVLAELLGIDLEAE